MAEAAAIAIGIRVSVNGDESARHEGKNRLERDDILETIAEANGLVERGEEEVKLTIRFKLPNGRYTKATLGFNSVVEPGEILSFGDGTPPPIAKWADENMFSAVPDEKPCEPGESFVHLTISDEIRGIIGRVTAMIKPGPEDAYNVSFAFCNKAEEFSRRTGRTLARSRMESGESYLIRKFTSWSRFDTIKSTVQEMMTNGESCMIVGDRSGENFPKWLRPEPHRDIPEPVQVVLRKVAFGSPVEGSDRNIAMEYLGLTGEHQTKFVLHNDEMNTFDQDEVES